MTEDPRDRLLQQHAPVVMVPRYGVFEPLLRPGHRFLAASDGLWLEVCRAWLYARYHLGSLELPLPYGDIGPEVRTSFRPLDLVAIKARFERDAERVMPNECAAWAVWNDHERQLEYRPLEPTHASPTRVTFDRPRLAEHEHLAIDMHSHGALPAGFSTTDDEDDAGEVKISSVYGGIGTDQRGWATRLCLLGALLEEWFP